MGFKKTGDVKVIGKPKDVDELNKNSDNKGKNKSKSKK